MILPTKAKGDTYSTDITFDAPPFASDLASVEMSFRASDADTVALTRSSATSGHITISNPAAWSASINRFALNLPPKTYHWSIKLTSAAGDVITPFYGTVQITSQPTSPA